MRDLKNIKRLKIIFIIFLTILPWSLVDRDKNSSAKYIDESSVGYYQTNTCEISLSEVVIKNFNNENVIYILDNYSSIGCVGKINGVDKVGDQYKVGVGANILFNFLYQSILWLTLLSFIRKKNTIKFKKHILSYLTICFVVILHLYGEQDFYKLGSRNFDITFSFTNYFLLSILLILLIVYFLLNEVLSLRVENILIFLPFFFLVSGTYNAMNLNIYLLIFVFLGIQYIFSNDFLAKNLKYSSIYFMILAFAWLSNASNQFLFDVDKIRGFSNTSNSSSSVLFWAISFYFIFYGIKYCFIKTDLINNLEAIFRNFLLAGGLISLFGIIGSISSICNFIIYYFFGLNKNGILGLGSIQGNTWRGFSASAEAIGEFYSIVFFVLTYLLMTKKIKLRLFDYVMLLLNFYGFIRANSVSSYVALIFVIGLLVVATYFRTYIKAFLITALMVTPILVVGLLQTSNTSYEASNKSIILEGMKYSNLFENELDRGLNVTRFFVDENDLGTIFLYSDNSDKISNSLNFLMDKYTPTLDIPFLPNPVASLSTASYVINRSEKWGIFFSKYDPNIKQLLFGYGPLQLVNYFNDFNPENIDGLVLPHSSVLNILLFFGLLGVFFSSLLIVRNIFSFWNSENIFCYLLILQFFNLIKSDSILYISSFILFLVIFLESGRGNNEVKN